LAIPIFAHAGTVVPFREQNTSVEIQGSDVVVQPDVATQIDLSSRDINRITCEGRNVKDVIFSQEKGLLKTIEGGNAYIKFLIKQDGTGKKLYRAETAEIYVVCGSDSTNYTLIATPKLIPAQHVRLINPSNDKIAKNQSMFEGMEFEKKILTVMKQAYTASLPASYTTDKAQRKIPSGINGVAAVQTQSTNIDGEGLRIKIINLDITDNSTEINVRESDFIKPGLADNPVAITLDHHTIKKGRTTRLFILEQPKKS
jgi:conjugal transfer pilus assembly protein TraK